MALWACRSCTTRFSVGAPACPHCGSLEHYEEGSVMPKITVHGGPSIAGETPMPLTRGEHVVRREAAAEAAGPHLAELEADAATASVSVSVDGVDQGPGEVVEFEGVPSFEPLPEAVEGDTTKQVSEPDYEALTKTELQERLAQRELPTSGTKAELVTRLRTHDEP
jgi:RNA polymerase subunit RPABC4/transcription elongation factor Spt4